MAISFDSFTLAAATADLGEEPAAREYADCIEFRMDMATDPLESVAAYDGELPVLVTNRPEWEGGGANAGINRLDTLEAAIEFEAVGALDIELEALEADGAGDTERALDLVNRAKEADVSVVVSTHDFESTPSDSEMADQLRRASDLGDVGKLAVTATDRTDALSVLSVTHTLTAAGVSVATMAMGTAGSHTRAVAPVYGSKIGYAPVDPAKATAPGQYDLETLRTLVDRLVEE